MISFTVHKRLLLKILFILILFSLGIGSTFFALFSKASPEEAVSLPIIMYHSVLKNETQVGDYRISQKAFETDLQYLKEHGYTTVVVEDLIAYIKEDKPLPEKPVMLTFDDGFYNNLTDVLPLLIQYNMKGIISPVGKYTEQFTENPDPNPRYAYLTWKDIERLQKSGHIEIQNHSYNMHGGNGRSGAQKKSGETKDAYLSAFQNDTIQMQNMLKEKSGVIATAYTYPLGGISKESVDAVKSMGFSASFSCYERLNSITKNPDCLYRLCRYNRSGKYTTEAFMKKANIL